MFKPVKCNVTFPRYEDTPLVQQATLIEVQTHMVVRGESVPVETWPVGYAVVVMHEGEPVGRVQVVDLYQIQITEGL